MALISRNMQYELLATGSALIVAWGIRKGLNASWKAIKKDEPPKNPAAYGTDWQEAMIWAGLTGLTAALGRVLVHRAAAHGWLKVTGTRPPGVEA
ncbi:MAG: DUF4235 domain-containing protein [Bacteroidia bacterium]